MLGIGFVTKNILHVLSRILSTLVTLQEKRTKKNVIIILSGFQALLFICILDLQGHCLNDSPGLYDAFKNN
jgi:hypothetical protein